MPGSTLVERLGLPPDASVLVITADGLGTTQAASTGVYDALRAGQATSAGLMVPCPWARQAAADYRGEDVGVHLVLNAEHERYRWGPITYAPSLLDGDGGFPRTPEDLWDHADVEEVRRECRSQLERAVLWGFDVTHLASHLDALCLRAEFFDVVLELACEYRLPLRLPPPEVAALAGFPLEELAREAGVQSPDRALRIGPLRSPRARLERFLIDPPPGVTELVVRPAADTPELRALGPGWAEQVDDHALAGDAQLGGLLRRAGVTLVGWRELRDAMRAHRPT